MQSVGIKWKALSRKRGGEACAGRVERLEAELDVAQRSSDHDGENVRWFGDEVQTEMVIWTCVCLKDGGGQEAWRKSGEEIYGRSDTSSEFAGVREEDAELARRRHAIGCFAVTRKPVW